MIERDQLTSSMWVALRGRRGLNEDDVSKDAKILDMSPVAIVRECVAWELGSPDWVNCIATLMLNVGANLEDFEHNN